MEHAGGVQLQKTWESISQNVKVKCIEAICSSILPISELDFPAYGSLYFTDAVFFDTDSKRIMDNNPEFCIGSHCRSTYWDCNIEESRYHVFKRSNRGSCEVTFSSLLGFSLTNSVFFF